MRSRLKISSLKETLKMAFQTGYINLSQVHLYTGIRPYILAGIRGLAGYRDCCQQVGRVKPAFSCFRIRPARYRGLSVFLHVRISEESNIVIESIDRSGLII